MEEREIQRLARKAIRDILASAYARRRADRYILIQSAIDCGGCNDLFDDLDDETTSNIIAAIQSRIDTWKV